MPKFFRRMSGVALMAALLPQAQAAELAIRVEIPRLNVAEYHRPYLAFWLEGERRDVHNLAVWYDLKMKDGEGAKWLTDLRQWWRKSGRELSFPVDGMTSATRAPGAHRLSFTSADPVIARLPAGNYRLVIEAVREVGGREVLSQSFAWPPKEAARFELRGKDELGAVAVELKP
ncbi:MAG: DUF2271 domain-containing protein [Azospira sp.]|nr:DUF2271 domain-containing protein [Azospira sp.]